MYVCTYACMHACRYVCMRTYAKGTRMQLDRTQTHTCAYAYARTHTYVRNTHVRTYARTYMRAYLHTCIHTYIHTYIHNMHSFIHTFIHSLTHSCIHTRAAQFSDFALMPKSLKPKSVNGGVWSNAMIVAELFFSFEPDVSDHGELDNTFDTLTTWW